MNEIDKREIAGRLTGVETQLVLVNASVVGLQKTVDEMRSELWKKVDAHESKLPTLESQVNDLRRLSWMIITTIFGCIITAVFAIIGMKHG